MQRTQNYNLCQWEVEDRILRSDFNADNQKIDAALAAAGNCRIAIGSYVGDGQYGAEYPNTLTFGFAPKLIFIRNQSTGIHYSLMMVRGMDRPGLQAGTANTANLYVTWDGNTISWYGDEDAAKQLNYQDRVYHYAAIG